MSSVPREPVGPSEEQLRYAGFLEAGMYVGLLILLVTFALYASGIVAPWIPKESMDEYWMLDVDRYVERTGIETGWGWVGLVGYGDFLNFVGIAVLAGVSILCYGAILPVLWRRGDWVYLVLCVLEILVLSLAASGILVDGHGSEAVGAVGC